VSPWGHFGRPNGLRGRFCLEVESSMAKRVTTAIATMVSNLGAMPQETYFS
jgi:hypothetical protein